MTDIRPISAGDEASWRELFRAYGIFYETEFPDAVLDGVWAWLLDPQHEVSCLVADDAGSVVGFAHVRRQADTFTAGPSWFLDDLFVAPARRGEGIARALIERVYADAATQGGGTVRWITAADNSTAQALYDRIATRSEWVTYEHVVRGDGQSGDD